MLHATSEKDGRDTDVAILVTNVLPLTHGCHVSFRGMRPERALGPPSPVQLVDASTRSSVCLTQVV